MTIQPSLRRPGWPPRTRPLGLRIGLLSVFSLLIVGFATDDGVDSSRSVREIVIKYRSEGPHALEDCAERITTSGVRFQSQVRDGSDSLDLLVRRHRLGHQHAIFRRATRDSLEQQRHTLRRRWVSSSERYPRGRGEKSLTAEGFPDLAHIYRMRIPAGAKANEVIEELNADPHVEYAQLNHVMDLDQAFIPNDPFFHSVGSWGQEFRDLWGPARIRAPEAWARSRGEGTIVAVVDTGLDSLHPDIVGNVWINDGEDLNRNGIAEPSDLNGLDDDGNGFVDDLTGFDFANSIDADGDGFYDSPEDVSDADPFDDDGHGSHVAGTIAAVGDNGIGIIGIAPRAKLMALKGFPAGGSASDVVLWRAVLYAAEMGATVVNNSWSCGTPCPENPLAEEVLSLVEALGTVVVTSAGNSTEDVLSRSPENGKHVITVGALGFDDRLARFSNRGWLMDVVAPGGGPNTPFSIRVARRNILSLLSSGASPFRETFAVGGEYLRFSGTSMSAPHVAGAVAVLRSLRPDLSPGDVRRLIRMSAEDLGPTGHDPEFGAGVLDVARLIDMELPDLELSIEAPSPGTLHDPGSGPLRIMGSAEGHDLAELEIDVGSGLAARTLEPIANFGKSITRSSADADLEDGVLAQWDTSNVPDGPYVIRLRARLLDGRTVEEHTVIGIERNKPIQISRADRGASRPSLSGRRIIWQVDEAESQPNGVLNHDLEIGFFPNTRGDGHAFPKEPKSLFERDGDQRNSVSKGREIAWDARAGSTTTIERCRLKRGSKRCEPIRVSADPGTYFEKDIGRDWLLWMRFADGVSRLEGCRIGPSVEVCVPKRLIAPEAGDGWVLSSFDGETLILRRGVSERARCRLTADDGLCRPELISFRANSPTPTELMHDGPLVAFTTFGIGDRLPIGCKEHAPAIGCVSTQVPVVQAYACWLGDDNPACDPIAITPEVPTGSIVGMDVSGRRVTWSIADDDESSAVHFCEFIPETQKCVDQRLGGSPLSQGFPSIDASRVVWEDSRLGGVSIFGLELPSVFTPRKVKARAGRWFWMPLHGNPGSSSETLRYEAEGIEGFTPEDANARFVSLGRDSTFMILVGRVPRFASGDAVWKLRARAEGGLFTDRVIEISVKPFKRHVKHRH